MSILEDKEFEDEDLKFLNQDSIIKADLGTLHEEPHKRFDKVIGPPRSKKHSTAGMYAQPFKQWGIGHNQFYPPKLPSASVNTVQRKFQEKGSSYKEFYPQKFTTLDTSWGSYTRAMNKDCLPSASSISPGHSEWFGSHFKAHLKSIDATSSKTPRALHDGQDFGFPNKGLSQSDETPVTLEPPVESRETLIHDVSSPETKQKNHWVTVRCQGKIKPFLGLTASEVIEKVNQVLIHLKANIKHEPIRVDKCLFLPPGHIKLSASSALGAGWLRIQMRTWAPMADSRLKFKTQTYKVVITNLPSLAEGQISPIFTKNLCQSNQINPQDIRSINYSNLSRRKTVGVQSTK
ncbi:hypothetical protein DFH28DRAFT_929058 [Melampsora americana]|nr:hypothetical protein DFH28DRAFT_929058 [Melampsora americana]